MNVNNPRRDPWELNISNSKYKQTTKHRLSNEINGDWVLLIR